MFSVNYTLLGNSALLPCDSTTCCYHVTITLLGYINPSTPTSSPLLLLLLFLPHIPRISLLYIKLAWLLRFPTTHYTLFTAVQPRSYLLLSLLLFRLFLTLASTLHHPLPFLTLSSTLPHPHLYPSLPSMPRRSSTFGFGTMASGIMAAASFAKYVVSGVMTDIDSCIITICFFLHAIASGLIGTIGALWSEPLPLTGMPETVIIPVSEPKPAEPPRPKPRKVSALPPTATLQTHAYWSYSVVGDFCHRRSGGLRDTLGKA